MKSAAILILVTMPILGQSPQEIRCAEKVCLVPQPILEQLVQEAKLANAYAQMCGWGTK